MSNRASRQRRKAAMAAIPKITCQELIDLGLRHDLVGKITEVTQRREAWIASLLDAAHRPLA